MKPRWAPIFFAAGLGAGWLIFIGSSHETAETGTNSAAPVVTKREPRPATTPHEAKFRSFAKQLPKLSAEEQAAFKKSLSPADRPAAIGAMLAQAGPDGAPVQTKTMLFEILDTWAGEDFEGAWEWSRTIENDASRSFVATRLLNAILDKDLDHALSLHLEMAAEDPEFKSDVPLTALKQAASKDAATFLELLGKLPMRNYGGASTGMNFAADFDFQQAADGITALRKSAGRFPSERPSNFLASWAERNADAAYAWFSKNPDAGTFGNFNNLLEGIDKKGVSGASHTWAAGKLNDSGPARDAMIRNLAQFNMGPTVISSIAQAMPDTASRDRFLGDLVTMHPFADPTVRLSNALNQMSTPEARLGILQTLGTSRKLDAAKIPDAQLQQWGLTRQQVEQAQVAGR